MCKDCPERCFYHLEEFDLFGYLGWKLKCPKILGNEIFISEIASWSLPSKEPLGSLRNEDDDSYEDCI